MSARGKNLPDFQSLQYDLTAFVRNPEHEPAPAGMEPRRLQIYVDLIFNNVESFLATTFPIAKSTFTTADWRALVRDYVARHSATSPYFLEIPQEFIEFLATNREPDSVPPWLLELCHYEWVELELDARLAETLAAVERNGTPGDALDRVWVLSDLIWPLGYRYPVHEIGPANARTVEPRATFLIVYRDDADRVRFIESEPATVRLLGLLGEGHTLGEGLAALADELTPRRDAQAWLERMSPILETLLERGIVLGPAAAA